MWWNAEGLHSLHNGTWLDTMVVRGHHLRVIYSTTANLVISLDLIKHWNKSQVWQEALQQMCKWATRPPAFEHRGAAEKMSWLTEGISAGLC